MTATCCFTFPFLLSLLCFIKGNTKGKLCYLLKKKRKKKKAKVHFQCKEKKQTHYRPDGEGGPPGGVGGSQSLAQWGHIGAADPPGRWILPGEGPGPGDSHITLES